VNCGYCEGWRATAVVEDDMIIRLTDEATDDHGTGPSGCGAVLVGGHAPQDAVG